MTLLKVASPSNPVVARAPQPARHLVGDLLTRIPTAQPEVVRPKVALNLPQQALQQRLRESQPAAASQAAQPSGRMGAWGVAAAQLGAYQSTSESYVEDGVSYQKTTETGPKGYNSTTVTYEKDGVSYVETTTSGNGKTTVRVEATSGDVTEVTTSNTSTLSGDLEDYVELNPNDLRPEGPKGTTTRTDTKTEVIDNSQDPPVVTVTQQSTGYSQKVGSLEPLEEGQSVYLPDGIDGDLVLATLPGGQFDKDQSGIYVSYVTQTVPEATTVSSIESRVVGTGVDGQPVRISNSRTVVRGTDGKEKITLRYAEKGTIARSEAEDAYLEKMASNDLAIAEQFGQVDSDWLDYEQTTVWTDGELLPKVTRQFGEPAGQDGLRATSVSDGYNYEYVTLERVSENGKRNHTETHVSDTNYLSTSDTYYGENGEYRTESTTYAGDLLIGSSQTSHELAFPPGTALPEQAPQGFSQSEWNKFRAEHPQGPVYRDQLTNMSLSQEGVLTEVQSDTYGALGSSITSGRQTVDGVTQVLQGYQGQDSGEMVINGHALRLDGQGGILLDGQTVVLPADLAAKFAAGRAGLAELSQLFRAEPLLAEKIPQLSGIAGALGAVAGVLAFAAADSASGYLNATSGILGSVSALGTLAKAGALSKGTGVVGGGIQAGVGIWEITDGNIAEGVTDIIGGVGAAVLPFVAANPVAAAVVGAVVVVSSLARWILDWNDDDGKKDPLYGFDGSEPAWTFG